MSAEDVNSENIKEDNTKSILIAPDGNDMKEKTSLEKYQIKNSYQNDEENGDSPTRRRLKRMQSQLESKYRSVKHQLENEITDLKSVNYSSTRPSELLPPQYHVTVNKRVKPIDLLKSDLRREVSPNTMNWNIFTQLEFKEDITMIKAIPNTFLIAIAEENLHFYSTRKNGLVCTFDADQIPRSPIASGCSTNAQKFIVGSVGGDIYVYDYYEYKLTHRYHNIAQGVVRNIEALETLNYTNAGARRCMIFILQQNSSVIVFDLYSEKLITDPKISDLTQVKHMTINQTMNSIAFLCENKIAVISLNGMAFERVDIKIEGKGTLKENQKDNQIEEDLIYWEEAKKINIVNSQFVATYTEKGLEKNSKYLAISRIAESPKFVACHPDILVAKDDKNYLWISEDFFPYMLVSKVQRGIKETPFAKLPLRGDFVEKINSECIAVSLNRKLTILKAALCYQDQNRYKMMTASLDNNYYACIVNNTEFNIFDINTREVIKTVKLEPQDQDIEIKGVILTPNMKSIILVFNYGCLKEYLLNEFEVQTKIIPLAEDKITHVSFSSDGRYMIYVREGCIVKLFDLNKFMEITSELDLIIEKLSAVAVSREFFILGTREGGLRKYNIKMEMQHVYRTKDSMIKQIAIDPSCSKIVATYIDLKLFQIFNAVETKEEMEIPTKSKISLICLPHKRKEYIACALDNLTIQIFDYKGRELFYIPLKSNLAHYLGVSITSIKYSMSCENILVQLSTGKIGIYKVDNEEPSQELIVCQKDQNEIKHLAVSEDEKFILCTFANHLVRVFDFNTRNKNSEYIHPGNLIKIANFIPDTNDVLTASLDYVAIYNIYTQSFRYTHNIDSEAERLLSAKFSTSKDCIFVGYLVNASLEHDTSYKKSESFDIFRLKGMKAGYDKYEVYDFQESNVKTGCLTPDESKIVMGMRNGSVKIVDYKTKEKLRNLKRLDIQPIYNITITNNSKYMMVGASNRIYKIIDLETYQERYEYSAIKEDNFSFALSPGIVKNRYILFIEKKSLKMIDIITKQITEIEYFKEKKELIIYKEKRILIANSSNPSLIFYSLDLCSFNYVNLPNSDKVDETGLPKIFIPSSPFCTTLHPLVNLYSPWNIKDWPDVYILKHGYNFLHLIAILEPQNLLSLPPYSVCKINFLIDNYGKTPLHYLLADDDVEIPTKSVMFRYIIDFLEDVQKSDPLRFELTMNSIQNLTPYLINKMTNQKDVLRYINLHLFEPFNEYGKIVPTFGKCTNSNMFYSSHPTLSVEVRDKAWAIGPDRVQFFTNILLPNYNIKSDNTLKLLFALSAVNSQEYFKTKAVSSLLDYLWQKNKVYHYLLMILFIIYLGFMSAYIILGDDRLIWLETVILVFASLMFCYELVRFYSLKLSYIKNMGNVVDISYFIFIIALIIMRYHDEEAAITRQWLYATSILVGYGKLISFLRVFSITRNLIRAMFVIFRRLSGFFIILALIIFGFGIVFFEFNRSTPFPLHLVESYNALFGNSNTTYDSVSKNVLSISVAGVLNVYLLNMLVTVIGDSLHAIQDVSILTDSKERIDLIMESTLVKRVLWRKKPIDFKKKCIVFCEQTGFNENDEVDELKSRIVELQDKIGRIEERFGNDMARFEEHMFRMEEKIDETLNKKLELIMHHVVDKNDELSEKAHNVVTQEFSARKRRTGHHLYQGNENYYSPS